MWFDEEMKQRGETRWELKEFIEKIASDVGYEYAKTLDTFIEETLALRVIGRIIVWAAKSKHFLVAKSLSRIVGLEVRITSSPIDLRVGWEIAYAGRHIGQRWFGIDLTTSSACV